MTKTKISKDTIIRTIVLGIALLNQILTMCGINPLPWSEDEAYTITSTIVTAVAAIWAWWKNNSLTPAAIEADQQLKQLKNNK